MTRSLHPPCAGSVAYGPHSAKVPRAYTLIDPSGRVRYCCDTDCLRRTLEADEHTFATGEVRPLRRIGR